VAAVLGTDMEQGLAPDEAVRRLDRDGPNELAAARRAPAWLMFARQFANTMIAVLGVAAVITAIIGDIQDTAVILVIVVLNAVMGFVQEYRAERALAALTSMTVPHASVVRGGSTQSVPIGEIVIGDLVLLAPGDLVPADLRLIEAHALRVSEAALTGESVPVSKIVEAVNGDRPPPIADQKNMAFRGTAVTGGRGAGVVAATGMATELGRIASLLQTGHPDATPLQRRLAALGRWMAAAAVVVCAVVFGAGLLRGEPLGLMFLTAVTLAVAAIPEGLPAVVTVSLALGARRMAARRALVRRLPAVETLGSVTVICTDKTGTLTENRMLVARAWTPAGTYQVSGNGYAPVGEVTPSPPGAPAAAPTAEQMLRRLAEVAAACNDATLRQAPAPAGNGGGPSWEATGDPTEAALLALAGKLGVTRENLGAERPRVAELAFDASRRRMTTVHQRGPGLWAATKGALDALLPLLDPAEAQPGRRAAEVAAGWAAQGYRVLALADRRLPAAEDPSDLLALLAAAESRLRLVGLVAMADPARPEAAEAVAACRSAGIVPVMITGDDPRTATAIARQVGILPTDEAADDAADGSRAPVGADPRVVAGAELALLDDAALGERARDVRVYARTDPEHKLRIVHAWQDHGAVVAMTGDGVNDAPALRRADIGVAMGRSGTEVSKEAADMVLADDNFATVVAAVDEGRRIYDNLRRFVKYLLTTNSGEVWVMFLASLLAFPVPLLPAQILWVNLVTDGLPAVALGLEPAEKDTMRRPPRPPREPILAGGLWQHALWVGLTMAGVCLTLLAAARWAGWPWQTMVFTTLALLQLGHSLAVRSDLESFFTLGARTNPVLLASVAVGLAAQLAIIYASPLQAMFHTEPLRPIELAVVLAASTAAFIAVEIEKWLRRRARRKAPQARLRQVPN
jgi:Ca2+-transporting ATPase